MMIVPHTRKRERERKKMSVTISSETVSSIWQQVVDQEYPAWLAKQHLEAYQIIYFLNSKVNQYTKIKFIYPL